MKSRFETKLLIFVGITALNVGLLAVGPLSYAVTSENSPDVITEELRDAAPLRDFHREIDRLFDRTFRDFDFSSFKLDRPLLFTADRMFRPVTDLSSSDKEYTVTVEIPGAEKEDIKIEVSNNVMTIRGEKKQKKEEENKNHHQQERFYGSFQRVLSLPKDADQNNIKANFRQGVLTVTMPRKAMPKPDIQEIPISSD
ncbi:MAG: Hsp20/alpha crystallin family protein [Candidatus Electrothrix sp. ATG1]|nr:Hsp20/alpha crystallin family protein [Candidatus Electrothrix sp. ATG1]